MTQDRNHFFIKAFRAVLVATMMLLTGSNALAQVTVKGSVYGGGNEADVQTNTEVNISYGTVEGNVYGGGNLGDVGRIDKTDASYNYKWTVDESGNTTETYNNTGVCTVNITGGTIGTTGSGNGYVFGGGKGDNSTFWCEKGMVYSTNVSISNGTVYSNVYGGGEVGRVESNTIVTIGPDSGDDEPEIKGSVFGAGKGLKTHGYSALVRGNPVVTIQGKAKISGTLDDNSNLVEGTGNVYGGGEIASVGKHKVKTPANANEEGTPQNLPMGMPWTLANTNLGICTVNVKGNATIAGNVYGAGKGIEPVDFASADPKPGRMGMTGNETFETNDEYLVYVHTLALATDTHVTIGGTWTPNETTGTITASGTPTISGSVYGGSENGFVQYHSNVTIAGGAVGNNVYGGGRGLATFEDAGQVSGNVNVSVNGGSVGNDVFGGGELGVVKKGVTVNITGGTVTHNVYGGGALADTNTENWDASTGDWRTGWTSADNTTTVNLKGGTIGGDAYGGGLGRLAKDAVDAQAAQGTEGEEGYVPAIEAQPAVTAVEAMVYGDVSVNQGTANIDEAPATAYTITYLTDNSDPVKQVVNSGRIFGCNNLNGSPKGNVTVTVNRTVTGKDGSGNNIVRTEITRDETTHQVTSVATPHTYEVAAVYGGGNLANYTPKDGKTQVIINSCDVSIEEVYGGGNAAEVPSTDVTVNGAHEIERVFGGGNGEDKYTLDGGSTWNVNPGADVGGYANTLIKGGYVHEAYGGSNEKGTISGNITIDTGSGGCAGCPVKVDKLVGAGKNADVNGNLIMIMGCKDATKIPLVYGGADNANVRGNVELTITSGNFGKVFGGNNLGGAILGHVILNIEETTNCEPIRIDELYLGGNQASYSRYGYYQTGVGANGNALYMPRTSATDTHKPVQQDGTEVADISNFTLYDEPVMNIISCTHIGEVFGGGYGVGGDMYANPTVNINMVPGTNASNIKRSGTSNAHDLGEIGDVYGGGNAADVAGNTTINIGTETMVTLTSVDDDPSTTAVNEKTPTVEGAYITGNVYGGGKLADVGKTHTETVGAATSDIIDVVGNTNVNIGTKYNESSQKWEAVAEGVSKVLIAGNVFGGGKGEAATSVSGSFRCGKAMVTGGTNVHIGNGKVGTLDANGKLVAETGNVYGGGEVGRVEVNPVVMIGVESGTTAPIIEGEVYGAGKGVRTHGYSALVRGNTTVTVQGDAKVRGSVYGGGEIGSVGRYNVATPADLATHPDVLVGMPFSLANNGSGYCTVIVQGNAEIGPEDEMKMTRDGGPDDTGYVFGGGKGVMPFEGYAATEKPWRVLPTNEKEFFSAEGYEEYYGTTYKEDGHDYEVDYFRFIETLALATQTNVTIGGNAFVKGSVYGGSFNGRVQHDTHVTIEGGQIGAGENVNRRYNDGEWASSSLAECPHWLFDKDSGAPYDKYATKLIDGKYYYDVKDDENNYIYAEGGSAVAKDGHTYYGNVFGGGSGSIPYAPGKWHKGAGAVGGDTYVNITGGHVLTSVYGGNEMTDVGAYIKDTNGQNTTTPAATDAKGKCTVNITGGTVGVPRTDAEKQAHPVVGNVFGASKGDQRIFFNTWTNVISTEVNISGDARIYGSVFGGGEDGHIIGDAVTNIGGTITIDGIATPFTENGLIIGTTGTSYYDGNVFGGGRGFSGDAQTAGTVGGNVRLNINAGDIYGSVYGGGRLASVGTMFEFPTDDDGNPNPAYGNFKEDAGNNTYGHVTVNISGGTIGNENATGDGAKYSGNVFGGSMGRLTLLNGDTNPIWPKMAQVKNTAVNIYGNADIKRSVYGGGELGTVRDNAYVTIGGIKTADVDENGHVDVSVQGGGTVGRDVYGGGYGSEDDDTHTIIHVMELPDEDDHAGNSTDLVSHTYAFTPMQFAGCVGQNTYVHICGGRVKKSVYGGGELASVGVINCRAEEVNTSAITPANFVVSRGETKSYIYSKMVKHAPEKVDGKDVYYGFGLSWPYEFQYVPTYDGKTHVHISGGRIGLTKAEDESNPFEDKDNGDVCGGGKGRAGDYMDYVFCANVGSTEVIVNYDGSSNIPAPDSYETSGDCIAGAVYGGAENGHVMGDTKLKLVNGLVGHSIYGGGSGKGKFSKTLLRIGSETETYTRNIYSITAGKVFGNTEVEMTGGTVVRNIYGGGNMGSVGKGNYAGGWDDYSTAGYGELPPKDNQNLWSNNNFLNSGKCTVKITGGTVGYINQTNPSETMYPLGSDKKPYAASLPYGNVFGGCRGESAPNITESPRYLYCPEFFVGYANETEVKIGKTDGSEGPTIKGSVYGGGMDGHVRRDASVTIYAGTIGETYDATIYDPNYWMALGNVYGAGSGVGKYKYDFNYDNKIDDTVEGITYHGNSIKEEDFSTSAGSVTRFTTVEILGGTIHRNVYGGGSLASIGAPKIPTSRTDNPVRRDDNATGTKGKQTLNEVKISGGQIGGDYSYSAGNHVYGGHVFGGSRGDASLNTSMFSTSMFTSITVNATNNPTIYGSIFGGGEVGIVKGSVDVNINGGTINDDVYGGGALANTNTETSSTVPYTTTVNLLGGTIGGDAYGGGLGQLAITEGVKWTQAEIDAAQEGDAAYGKTVNDWKEAPTVLSEGAGTVKATVYGDIYVNLGSSAENSSATAFNVTKYEDEGHVGIVKSGRVFGCNNLNGSPQGNVRVTVYKTVKGNIERTDPDAITSNKALKESHPDTYENEEGYVAPTYHVAAVYGGGNLADYTTAGKKASVRIETCQVSIRDVYGGGNAAEVPETDVLVRGAYEIQEVFGGGNGKDPYVIGTDWFDNPGANIGNATHPGNATTLLTGGFIHEAYGGSNEKGEISGSVVIDMGVGSSANHTNGACDLDIEKLVGAGKNADMNGVIKITGCNPSAKIPLLYAGADNANVKGDVELTITSGNYGKVFGGNNAGGAIFGHIKLNIEETGNCETPITIDELYLGGNMAAYSQYGYYNSGTEDAPIYQPRTSASDTHTAVYFGDGTNNDHTKAPYAQPELNVISCTYIGKVFGGGYGTGATLYGDPIVNINMIQGSHYDDNTYGVPAKMTALNIPSTKNPNKLGIIGDVFGGGNAADVIGNPTVNIGTATTVTVKSMTHNADETYTAGTADVLGAYISGDVFGGGNKADVTGNTYVYVCAVEGDDPATTDVTEVIHSVSGTAAGVTIEGTRPATGFGRGVFGGGNQGEVTGNSYVYFGGGTVNQTVYGGGCEADVKGNTNVTMLNGYVVDGVCGGGLSGSVGTITSRSALPTGHSHGEGETCVGGKPDGFEDGTGKCTVVITGGQVGPVEVATQGMTAAGGPVSEGWVWGASRGVVADPESDLDSDFRTYVNSTDVTIGGTAFILEGVVGGGEFGHVHGNTLVKIQDQCQIGVGADQTETVDGVLKPKRYSEAQWAAAEAAVRAGNTTDINTAAAAMPACSHFPYGKEENGQTVYDTYDPYAEKYPTLYPGGSTDNASDGKTWIGCVFGGGSGFMPYEKTTSGAGYDWDPVAGLVEGDSEVRITGGHILTCVYGGNEITSVNGTSKVTMTGGTIGVPRKKEDLMTNPMIGNLYGAGKGDPRTEFNGLTNVGSAEVEISGGIIFGSVYGGSEDGHVLGDVNVKIQKNADSSKPYPIIGTWGASYVDGNVYGGGMGTTSNILAGLVKGNTKVDISDGIILHNIYGGGAYGSVGEFDYDTNTGLPTGRRANTTGGIATIEIKGGAIGTTGHENGMVFGSSRGDVGAPGDIHDQLAWVYDTHITIGTSGQGTTLTTPLIKGSIYGSGENGHTYHDAEVIIHSGTIGITDTSIDNGAEYLYRGNVYGGGCGTDTYPTSEKYDSDGDGDIDDDDNYIEAFNPLAGIVYGDATVTIDGGQVVHNVYGAGAMGSVGKTVTTNGVTTITGGTTTISISGGTIGVSGTVGDGNVFGAARGDVDATSNEYALVRKTTGVSISGSALVKGNVYGGGELGCVGTYSISDGMRTFTWQDTDGNTNTAANSNNKNTGITNVTITGGTIGTGVEMSAEGSYANGNVFGAGKGKEDTFWCEKGIVYKANVNVTAGTVKGNVYGGGEVGRVETDATVKIGPDSETASPNIYGNVFGGGAGVKTHGYSALVRGNTYVTIQSSAQVGHNVYGGGQIAAVGKYYLNAAGMPYSLVNDQLGICNVTVKGSAAITGSVFGGGKGKDPENLDFVKPQGVEATNYHTESYDIDDHMPKRMMNYYENHNTYWEYFGPSTNGIIWEYFDTVEKYHTFLETLGLTTQSKVTIGGTRNNDDTVTSSGSPTINGNVYGGSESGFVQHNTSVAIAGGTIGTTTTGGNVFGGGLGLATFAEAGRVRGNTTVTINAGTASGEPKIFQNVYGGGQLGDVGTIVKRADYNYKWTNTDPSSIDLENPETYPWNSTGVCTVTINGGTIGTGVTANDDGTYANGNIYGAGKGLENTWWCEKAMAYKTNVTITDGTINGTVYGGGQVGRVENDATVTIGTADETGTGSKPNIIGNVFGAGAGVKTHGYSALVRGDAYVTIQGIAQVGGSVYGGGEIASVGKFTVVGGLPKHPDSGGTCTVTIQDHAKIGADGTGHNVFGACKGVTPAFVASGENRSKSMQLATNAPSDANLWSSYEDDPTYIWRYYPDETAYRDFLETLALTSHPIVTIAEDATINGSVFGGGERGVTLGSVEVNMNGGTVTEDVYGGGSLANTNKGNWDDDKYVPTTPDKGTSVNGLYSKSGETYTKITDATATANGSTTYYIKGAWADDMSSADYTTTVNLKGGMIKGDAYGGGLGQLGSDPIEAKVYGDVFVKLNETTASDNCVVEGNIFGCNNVNGTPKRHATVHVFKTVNSTPANNTKNPETPVANRTTYDLAAVFGGGKSADYVPEDATQSTEVIIEGCDMTSIEEVYGGGYGAAVPGTNVLIKGTYIINNVYGGGYGASTDTYTNPGANVGFLTGGTPYSSGDGKAIVQLMAGTINNVYGGSNTKGDIRGGSNVTSVARGSDDVSPNCCTDLNVQEIYGGGKSADMFGGAEIVLGCMPNDWIGAIYAGAENANVGNDVSLTLTSGKFGRVFGGNKSGGTIDGYIEVNIEENPDCATPIIIGEIYGGGNQAEYIVPQSYVNSYKELYNEDYPSPRVNVRAFTSIGNIYGGGFGKDATVTGNPTVNIDVVEGGREYAGETKELEDESTVTLYPRLKDSKMGVIGNVYGGGNAAKAIGNTYVNIGAGDKRYNEGNNAKVKFISTGDIKTVVGADIRGNVYGGGNAAEVTGDTNVQIGKKKQ